MNLRFVSIRILAEQAWVTFARFPFVLLAALAAAVTSHVLAGGGFSSEQEERFISMILAASLGIPLFFSLRLLGEGRDWPRQKQLIAALVGLVGLLVYYISLPGELREADGYRFALLNLSLHLWVAFAPFTGLDTRENGFWQYNKTLFLRFWTAVLYSAVLYIGLALALAACDALLGLDIEEETYLRLWFWIAWIYNTWFFLAGIPEDVRALEEVRDYPRGLRVFTQYVLIPLVVVYLVILYAYLAKIIVQWDLPQGWVGYPVIGISVAGIFALLLMHPIREREENAWVNAYGRFFYLVLYPLIGLIAVAIATRMADYGMTEKRYLVVVLTAWLFGMATYYTVKNRGSIRVIPMSLCILMLLSAFGPWSAAGVSKRSQLSRLRQILVTEEVMVGGQLSATQKTIEFEREKEISNIIKYLKDSHGLEVIRGWYADSESLPDTLTLTAAMSRMGLEYINQWQQQEGVYSLYVAPPNPLEVAGYDYVYEISEYMAADSIVRIDAMLDSSLQISLDGTVLEVISIGDAGDAVSLDLAPTIQQLRDSGAGTTRRARAEDVGLYAESDAYRMAVFIEQVNASGSGAELRLRQLTATVLIGIK